MSEPRSETAGLSTGKTDETIVEMRRGCVARRPTPMPGAPSPISCSLRDGPPGADEYTRYLQLAPGNAAAHTNSGLALVKQHRAAEAGREFRTALALAPTDAGASQNLARAIKRLTASGAI